MLEARSGEMLKTALERLPSPVLLVVDADREEFWMNAALAAMLGLDPEHAEHPSRTFTLFEAPFTLARSGRIVAREDLPLVRAARGATIENEQFELHLPNGRVLNAVVFARNGIMTLFDVTQEHERASERLRFLAEAGEALSEATTIGALISTLQRQIVPRFAALCAIVLLDDASKPAKTFYYHVDPTQIHALFDPRRHKEVAEPKLTDDALEVIHTGESRLGAEWTTFAHEGEDRLEITSSVTIPIKLHGRVIGLVIAGDRRHRRYLTEDVRLLEDLARRAAPVLDRVRLLERHEQTSGVLQHALLPAHLPTPAHLRFDAVYEPGGDEALIGGDWYDAFEIPDGRVIVTIGDVTGRGIQAATLMSKARQSISALTYYETDPVRLLDVADKTLRRRFPEAIITAMVGVFDTRNATFTYATAGHPPPYLRRRDGTVIQLPSHGLPLGLRSSDESSSVTLHLVPGDCVFCFTDGLIEATHDLDEGERRLVHAIQRADRGDVAAFVRDTVLPDGSPDDVAILATHFGDDIPLSEANPQRMLQFEFDARDVRMARESRMCAVSFLRSLGAPESLLSSAELVYGELISNVVRHAPGVVTIRVDWREEKPAICTVDRGAGYAKTSELPSDPYSESGRGLFIIESLTSEFNVRRATTGGSDVCAVLS